MNVEERFAKRISEMPLDELVSTFNKDVGHTGWVSARGKFLAALKKEFLRRGVDCSCFISKGSMTMKYEIEVDDDCIRIKFPENFRL